MIQLDRDLSPCGEFTTLINPGRDIGATHIHSITARDVVNAPRFDQVAPMLLDILRGRVVVAHNVQFDLRFLHSEFARIGISLPELPVMCTMQLAPQYLPRLPARSLAACCAAAGIKLDGVHAATIDARAVAMLLACYAGTHHQVAAGWIPTLAEAARVQWPTLPPVMTQLVTREVVARRREQEVPFLARLVQQLPRFGTDANVESYLAVLDTVLEDRRVTATEAESLHDLAVSLGLGAEVIIAAHQTYLRALAVAAWADGVITDAEYADLGEVARLLGFPAKAVDIELATAHGMSPQMAVPVNGRELRAGDAVCITGSTGTPREELEARASGAGLRVTSAVSGKTRLVIAADPDSESAKARRARELNIPLIAEPVFRAMLDHVAPLPAPTVPPLSTPADSGGRAVSRPGASWLAYPTLSHGDAGMVKLSGPTYYRPEINAAIRRFGALALAELRVETTGQYAGAVRVFVDGMQVASIPRGLQNEYREVVESLNREGVAATIHVELESGAYVDVWGLCKPERRREGEPLLPTQYREDIDLLDGIASALDESLASRAKEKKVRRNGVLSLGSNGVWSVSEGGRVLGTLKRKPYKRLYEIMGAGLPLDVVVTVHRRPERELVAHVSIPHDA